MYFFFISIDIINFNTHLRPQWQFVHQLITILFEPTVIMVFQLIEFTLCFGSLQCISVLQFITLVYSFAHCWHCAKHMLNFLIFQLTIITCRCCTDCMLHFVVSGRVSGHTTTQCVCVLVMWRGECLPVIREKPA